MTSGRVPPSSAADHGPSPLGAGIDAALIVTALGLMYALLAFGAFGARGLPFGLHVAVAALVVGGGVAMLVGRSIVVVAGPSASSALIVAGMLDAMQSIPDMAGRIDMALFATAAVALGAGLMQLAFARARLGAALKFVPFPVLMGFVNAVGAALVVSVAPFALGHSERGRIVAAPSWLIDWHPWSLVVAIVGTVAGYAVVRWLPRWPAAFVGLVSATAVHHAIARGCPTCALGPTLAVDANGAWPDIARIATATPTGIAGWSLVLQAALTLGILNALFSLMTAAQVTRPVDAPIDGNKLLAKIGVGSAASALVLGLPIALIASASMIARRVRDRSALALIAYAVAVVLAFTVGRRSFGLVPMAAVASAVFVIARTQFDAATWPLLRNAARLHAARGPLVIMSIVVVVALVRGLVAALFIGALATACLLAIELRRSVVLSSSDGRTRRSRRIRSTAERTQLDALGAGIRVIELGHWLYFGTADELARLAEADPDVRWLLFDARRVAGIDMTAARSLVHAADRLAARGASLALAGIADDDPRRPALDAMRIGHGRDVLILDADIDAALERAEDELLAMHPPAATQATDGERDVLVERLAGWLESTTVAAGETLFNAGDPGDRLYFLRGGRITLWVGDDAHRTRLLTFEAGSFFGELALLDGRPRSAHARADADCRLETLSRDALDAIARDDPGLHARVLHALALNVAMRLREVTTLLDRALH